MIALRLLNKWCMYWGARAREDEWAERKKELVLQKKKREDFILKHFGEKGLLDYNNRNVDNANQKSVLDDVSKSISCGDLTQNSSCDNVSHWSNLDNLDTCGPCYSSMSSGGVMVDYKAWETISLDGECESVHSMASGNISLSDNGEVSDNFHWSNFDNLDTCGPCYSSMSSGGVMVDYTAWDTISLDEECESVHSTASDSDNISLSDNGEVSHNFHWSELDNLDTCGPCYSSMSSGGVLVDYKAWETISVDGDCESMADD